MKRVYVPDRRPPRATVGDPSRLRVRPKDGGQLVTWTGSSCAFRCRSVLIADPAHTEAGICSTPGENGVHHRFHCTLVFRQLVWSVDYTSAHWRTKLKPVNLTLKSKDPPPLYLLLGRHIVKLFIWIIVVVRNCLSYLLAEFDSSRPIQDSCISKPSFDLDGSLPRSVKQPSFHLQVSPARTPQNTVHSHQKPNKVLRAGCD